MPELATQLASLPPSPGVYIFKDAAGHVLYVGKAKSLRVRVRSYFRESANLDPAKQQMVPRIAAIDPIVVDSENEALILEANLIRQHRPPYNVVLTDDKHYLFIKITTNETYPRVFPVRRLKRDGARYFGPYSSSRAVRHTLKLLRRLFPYRDDKTAPDEWTFPHPLFTAGTRPAEPLAPDQYRTHINHIIKFLEGNRTDIITTLRQGMRAASLAHDFERAAIFRDQLQAVERLEGDQKVYLPRQESFDAVSIATTGSQSAANVFTVRRGKLINKNTFLLHHKMSTPPADILRQFVLQYYRDAQDKPPVILLPELLPDSATLFTWINPDNPPAVHVPQRGRKRQLLDMGRLNAEQLLHTEQAAFNRERRAAAAVAELAAALKLPAAPSRIETYDISNIQGQLATGSMVVFIDGTASKAHYRKFRIKRHTTANDYAMLQEVLRRRLSHRATDWVLPDLIIIDGGKGQLNAARAVLAELGLTTPLAALAKREEELFLPDQAESIRLPFDSDALYLVQRMRDEAHRFTLAYHRTLRSSRATRSLLDDIPGLGPKTRRKLLSHFGSVRALRAASLEELRTIIGNRADQIHQYL